MSADLFDFHRGEDRLERMKDGEKRKLTLLNPMRNVGFAVNISFFSYSATSIRGVFFNFSAQLRADSRNGDITYPELN